MAFLPSRVSHDGREGHSGSVPALGGPSNGDKRADYTDFSTPNLYELVLALSSEPGLEAWWNAVAQIATEHYRAERISLAIPSDSTDVENMPWGQKATFNLHEKADSLSVGYMGWGSSPEASTTDLATGSTPILSKSGIISPTPQLPVAEAGPLRRPSLANRYSYTTYEEQKESRAANVAETAAPSPARPPLSRCHTTQPVLNERSNIPRADQPPVRLTPKYFANLNQAALEEHNAVEGPQEAVHSAQAPLQQQRNDQGRVLPVLQALDYEADPLIDHYGVQRVLDRGHVVALTRSYPYTSPAQAKPTVHIPMNVPQTDGYDTASSVEPSDLPVRASDPSRSSTSPNAKKSSAPRPSATYLRRLTGSSIASKLEETKPPRSVSPLYEEYEQLPPSPWSQSPAPSPAVRHDPDANPFFSNTVVDEDCFNPQTLPEEYANIRPPEAIGLDSAWTVLHIPLYHPLLSKASQPFRLDRSKMERRASPNRESEARNTGTSPSLSPSRQKQMPIAILSILSPVIPYPSNLRHSLEHLASHLATSFSLCVHYSNLEAEVNGLGRRRFDLGGFGGIDTEGHHLSAPLSFAGAPFLPPDDSLAQRSHTGSMTSYSDYSARSRSIAGTPGGTPGWDSVALNPFLERRANTGSGVSPSIASLAGDGYFGMRSANMYALSRPATTPGGASNSGEGAGAISGQRGTKSSLSHSERHTERRMSALRMPEVVLSAQEDRFSSPVRDQTAAENHTEYSLAAPQQIPRAAGPGTSSTEAGTGGSTETSSSPASSRLGQAISTRLEDAPNMASSSQAEQRISDRVPLLSPMPSIPGGMQTPQRHARFHHRQSHSHSGHSQLHSYGADFTSTFPSLPPSGTIAIKVGNAAALMPPPMSAPSREASVASSTPVDMPPPSDRLKSLILDSLPAHVFVAVPQTGAIVWVNSRYLAYRGQTVEGLADDPWGSLHPDDRDDYLKAWSHSVRTGDQFSRTVRIRRFDGTYRWFQARAVTSRDRRNSIVQFLGSFMDIHDQYIAELRAARQEEIEASETKHRILANLIPEIIFTANEEEGVTFANEQWQSYSGQSFQDLIGLGFMDNVHPDDLAKCSFIPVPVHLQERRKHLLRTISSATFTSGVDSAGDRSHKGAGSGLADSNEEEELSELAELARRGVILATTDDNGRPSYTTEVRLRSKTGEYRWHLVRCVETGTMDFGKGYNSYFGSATDINDHKLLETKLKEAMDYKTRFLSNMSHEIRTPLIGISGMVSFLQDTTLNEEQRDYTNTIQTSANSLLMIINDILDLSKVDAGMMKLSFEWFHTRSLIEDVNELVSTMAIAKGLELSYIVDTDVPSWVKGDRVRIRQVLLNVIGNAIKFTAKGEVFSRCRVIKLSTAATDSQIELAFSVMDTGRGFTKEEAELIFKPFSQIDGSSTRQHGGSGLGLVISRQLVELHGGKMHGSAVSGKGSTFTFTAVFSLPTDDDHPDGLTTPSADANIGAPRVALTDMGIATPSFMDHAAVVAAAAASAAGAGSNGLPLPTVLRAADMGPLPTASPATASSGSSEPSARSVKSQSFSEQSSSESSANGVGLARFSEAARANGQDLERMSFRVPPGGSRVSPTSTADSSPDSSHTTTTATTETTTTSKPEARKECSRSMPSALSILIICPQTHSREATTKHIDTTIPKDRPHKITAVATVAEALSLIRATAVEPFTHVVINLPSPQEILELVDDLDQVGILETADVLVLSDSVQRQAVNKLAVGTRYEERLKEARVTYIYKPVKPSRFAVIFDPERESDISIDRNRHSARRLVKTQKQSYLDLEQRMGNKGYRVLLVEDNLVNQKVLTKYLHKVGVEVDMAADGVECTDIVLMRPHEYYSLILVGPSCPALEPTVGTNLQCDLHMPRKDGYQACREIREWEAKGNYARRIPIIALSANVMSDVHDKCVEAGFSKYITKPVDFIVLSRALAEFF